MDIFMSHIFYQALRMQYVMFCNFSVSFFLFTYESQSTEKFECYFYIVEIQFIIIRN